MTESLMPRVDADVCTGHGRCYLTAPDNFEPDDDGYPIVIAGAASPAAAYAISRAIQNCPERAITVEAG